MGQGDDEANLGKRWRAHGDGLPRRGRSPACRQPKGPPSPRGAHAGRPRPMATRWPVAGRPIRARRLGRAPDRSPARSQGLSARHHRPRPHHPPRRWPHRGPAADTRILDLDGAFGGTSTSLPAWLEELPDLISGISATRWCPATPPWLCHPALALILPVAAASGMRRADHLRDGQRALARVIEANGGISPHHPAPRVSGKTKLCYWVPTGAEAALETEPMRDGMA